MKKEVIISTQEFLNITKYFGALMAVFALLFGAVQWVDNRYVDQRIFEMFQDQKDSQRLADSERLVQVFEAMEKERDRDLIMIYRAIRDASMAGLTVRRDILISRGRDNLSEQEKAELEILEVRLRDLTID